MANLNYQLKMLMRKYPLIDAIEKETIAMENGNQYRPDQFDYDKWIADKRLKGKKKFNRIDKRQRRLAIKKKSKGYH